jgi:hypothetical protein
MPSRTTDDNNIAREDKIRQEKPREDKRRKYKRGGGKTREQMTGTRTTWK